MASGTISTLTTSNKSSKIIPITIFTVNLLVVLYLFFINHKNISVISKQRELHATDSVTILNKEQEIVELEGHYKKLIVENKGLGLTVESMESTVKELEKLRREVKSGKLSVASLDAKLFNLQKRFISK